ncbi:KY [Cordylochernes scorpioides]|uniref:KY n=1 Tax=Cordylochernes scorpioides TaxID=51811 RepID=A0ABY6LP39_9ARAC|nr:KY [Cordylochernes scorpioides]
MLCFPQVSMGCGISKDSRVITPMTGNKSGGTPHQAWGSPNGHVPSTFEPVVANAGAQTEEMNGWATEAGSQTDPYPEVEDWYPMEVELSRVPSLSDMETQTFGSLVAVAVQTETDTVLWHHNAIGKLHALDVAVQVSRPRTHRYVQTLRTESSKHCRSGNNRVKVDLETQTDELTPLEHIDRQLRVVKRQETLSRLLLEGDAEMDRVSVSRDAATQTADPATDDLPEYAAVPPPSKKNELLHSLAVFRELDQRVLETPEEVAATIPTLVEYLTEGVPNDLFRVRAFFRWIAENISFNWQYLDVKLGPQEILERREGVCKDYCRLLEEMCRISHVRVKTIRGFAKGHDYRPGHRFSRSEGMTHAWSAVFVLGAWRLLDTTWGAGYADQSANFQKKLNEHFFLTDPEVLVWTHFPFDDSETDYDRWQLLDHPLTLDHFNELPKVTPHFFELHLHLRSRVQNPLFFRIQTEVRIASIEPMRFKFKLYPADDVENSVLNRYVFCQLKEERLVGSFNVSPPTEGRYVLKIYARPESHTSSSVLRHCCTLLLHCERARKYHTPYPINDLPWGPTQNFYDFNLRLVNQPTPLVVTWGGKKKVTIDFHEPMLVSHQLFDADGTEMDPKGVASREDSELRVVFTISPTRAGFYKLMVYALPRPKVKGKWRMPLVASFLIECKLIKQSDDDIPITNPKAARRKIRVRALR